MSVIGRKVLVQIDRPLGSRHPEHPDLVYPVNYGFVTGVPAPDGEWQDAYVLGPEEPLEQFEGVVTAVLVRADDIETKWIVEDKGGPRLSDAEIRSLTAFQERYFQTTLTRCDD